MRKTTRYVAIAVGAAGLFGAGFFSAMTTQHSPITSVHEAHSGNGPAGIPSEGGQGAFAALAEIVALLEADPDTDWKTVNIAGLREHLVDMNALTLNANVTINETPDGAVFVVTGDGITLRAIQSMVPAHANELDKMQNWSAEARLLPNGARLAMTSTDASVVEKIQALGFFGLMATGAHHQPHHLGMAKGTMVH